ncbi:25038_t:CDS:2, partial [Dentiscutata erythropus]
MFTGKFVVENLDQYITVSYPYIIATGDSERAFAANEIPLSAPHCMFTIQVTRDPKELESSTYFDATNSQYNSVTNSKNVLMKLRTYIVSGFIRRVTTDFTIIELTDIDFISTNVSSVQYVQESTSSNTSNNRSFIDLIAEDVDSTTSQQSKRTHIIMSRSSKQSTVPPPIVNEPETPITTPTPVNIGPETFQSQK